MVDIIAPLARCSLYALQCFDEFSAWHVSDQRRVSCQKKSPLFWNKKSRAYKKHKSFLKTNHFHYWVVNFGSFLQIIFQILQSSHITIYTDRPYIILAELKLLACKTTVLHQCHHHQAAKSKFDVEIKPLKMKKTLSDPSTHLRWFQPGSRTESHVWSVLVRE